MATLPPILRPTFQIEDFLAAGAAKDLLRFTTAGSVDDGKSTLIGRLLYDSQGVYEDQLASVTNATVNRSAGPIDFSLLTDGLRAEREQGITIDVAYRYFATARRKFIIADTPGHEQYTRNMATGASTADLAMILIDARNGVLPQSRRHAFISSLLGIPNFVVAVNKMDVVGYDEYVFRAIESRVSRVSRRAVRTTRTCTSAHQRAATATMWSAAAREHGLVRRPSLLEYPGNGSAYTTRRTAAFRFPVQRVIRPNQISGATPDKWLPARFVPGDSILALPSGRRSRVKASKPSTGGWKKQWRLCR